MVNQTKRVKKKKWKKIGFKNSNPIQSKHKKIGRILFSFFLSLWRPPSERSLPELGIRLPAEAAPAAEAAEPAEFRLRRPSPSERKKKQQQTKERPRLIFRRPSCHGNGGQSLGFIGYFYYKNTLKKTV